MVIDRDPGSDRPGADHVCRIRLAGAEARRDQLERAVRAVLAPFARAEGVYMPSSTWIVTAKRPS